MKFVTDQQLGRQKKKNVEEGTVIDDLPATTRLSLNLVAENLSA